MLEAKKKAMETRDQRKKFSIPNKSILPDQYPYTQAKTVDTHTADVIATIVNLNSLVLKTVSVEEKSFMKLYP